MRTGMICVEAQTSQACDSCGRIFNHNELIFDHPVAGLICTTGCMAKFPIAPPTSLWQHEIKKPMPMKAYVKAPMEQADVIIEMPSLEDEINKIGRKYNAK